MENTEQTCRIHIDGDLPETDEGRAQASFQIAQVALGKFFDAYPDELKPFACSALLSASAQLSYQIGGSQFLREGLAGCEATLAITEKRDADAEAASDMPDPASPTAH